ncbi:MAG: DNA polymerase III subunit delta' [Dehalogenimonas sp.]|uniref:DNA polymerase III subunit delta n=1 Tax=Candidatus Dehalogenimonas loeffleri TaxID=3127115 RepID=A0ABZ2J2X9_9CHLR|nr:DNA polymerase III subunit delta' [Dehalogenimonas sp.]
MNSTWGLIGLDNPIKYLSRAIENGEIFQAYIFNGPEHSGKHTLALKFAQALNCVENNPPCGTCESCRRIIENLHPDIQITEIATDTADIKAKTSITVEQIRDINHAASLPPYESQYRVFIIEQAEKMTISAANAFLKTLEEPAAHLVFILITTNLAGLPETVRSRCQILNIGLAKEHDIRDLLIQNHDTPTEQADLLSRLCQGRAGWAVSAIDDISILQQRESDLDAFVKLLPADYKIRFDSANQIAGLMAAKREDVYSMLASWGSFCRDILLCKLNITDSVVNLTHFNAANYLAAQFETDEVCHLLQSIVKTSKFLGLNANPKLTLESLMLELPLSGGPINHYA